MAATRRTASEYSYSKTLYGSIRYAQSSGPARFHVVWSTWKTRCCNSSSEESKEEHNECHSDPVELRRDFSIHPGRDCCRSPDSGAFPGLELRTNVLRVNPGTSASGALLRRKPSFSHGGRPRSGHAPTHNGTTLAGLILAVSSLAQDLRGRSQRTYE